MKIIFYIFLTIATISISYGDTKSITSKTIKFLDISYDDAINMAKKENKLLMMFIHEKGGPWCEKMRRNAFMDKDVVSILDKRYISIQFDKYQDEVDIPDELIPDFIPMVYLIDAKTLEVIVQLKGYATTKSLYSLLEETMEFYSE